MEKREENIKVIHRITKSSPACFNGDNKCDDNGVFSNHDHIPIDLTRDILMRLPAKSIAKFRCISKLWWSITTQPDFINSFVIRQSSIPRQNLLITFIEKGNGMNQIFCVLPIQKNSTRFFDVNNFHFILPPTKVYNYYTVSVNGLITFTTRTEIIIWNPTMKEHITFVKPKSSKCLRSFLGYDPMENTYKLLSLASSYKRGGKYQKPKILTLGSQESSWRVINSSPDHDPSRKYYCINGVVYYRADTSLEEDRDYHSILPPLSKEILELRLKEIIMSFDVRSEQFKSIQIPGRKFQYESMLEESLMSYQGKVAWICYNSNIIKLWVLKDAEKQVWSENEFVLPLPQRDLPRIAWLRGATSTGEFIYVSGNAPKNISAFYYDPVRKIIRSVKGIENEKFRGCYGSNDNFISSIFLHAFPNHIENLMSLKSIMCSPFV